ncbi:unnamed protein product [Allacma fusca]|uniref:Uncharacterized protein n=1 Tax=Allacma fusca TaxID=39272 RepID=A0A8J2K6E1_9HEXA|nr:unnamed protein product [Allacma fusca]
MSWRDGIGGGSKCKKIGTLSGMVAVDESMGKRLETEETEEVEQKDEREGKKSPLECERGIEDRSCGVFPESLCPTISLRLEQLGRKCGHKSL